MKQYKFRGKSVDTNRWVYGSLVQHYDGSCDIFHDESFVCEQENNSTDIKTVITTVDPITVGMYSGMFDFSGHNMYEGDITWYGKTLRIISFKQGTFLSEEKGIEHAFGFNGTACSHVVVGNIHDHKVEDFLDDHGMITTYKGKLESQWIVIKDKHPEYDNYIHIKTADGRKVHGHMTDDGIFHETGKPEPIRYATHWKPINQ